MFWLVHLLGGSRSCRGWAGGGGGGGGGGGAGFGLDSEGVGCVVVWLG